MNTGIPGIIRRKYKLIQLLGKGGFGETYLARDVDNPSCKYAVKIFIPPNNTKQLPVAMKLFNREAETLKDLNHPQIPTFFDFFKEDQEFYLIQEYIEGNTLSAYLNLQSEKKLEETEVVNFLKELLEILDYVHAKDIIHRDIKPENIIRRSDGKFVLIDFGIVKKIIAETTIQTSVVGTRFVCTPYYAPPEQMYDGHPKRYSDIYALGITAIVALTGLQVHDVAEDSWNNQTTVSNELARILSQMIRRDFKCRYQSVKEVKRDLNELLTPTPQNPTQVIQQPSPNIRNGESSINMIAYVLLVVLSIIAILSASGLIPERREVKPNKQQSLLVEKVISSG